MYNINSCDIFDLQTVSGDELIHIKTKEIVCIFKIRSTNVGNDSQHSLKVCILFLIYELNVNVSYNI